MHKPMFLCANLCAFSLFCTAEQVPLQEDLPLILDHVDGEPSQVTSSDLKVKHGSVASEPPLKTSPDYEHIIIALDTPSEKPSQPVPESPHDVPDSVDSESPSSPPDERHTLRPSNRNGMPRQKLSEVCGKTPHHMRASVRYTTPRGIGYHSGYTTLEGFFAPQDFLGNGWLPFLDLRGHVFDNGKFAANAGLGVRYLGYSRVWGANAYYDYRNTPSQHYNQVAAGLETLGHIWDFRINGYLPVGSTSSSFSSHKFGSFRGHNLLFQSSRHFAMKGANAEVGAHVDHYKSAPLYFAAGSYYLTGKGRTTWGGELRAVVDLLHRHLRIEGNTSYDHLFKWIGQGQVSLHLPFGGRSKVTKEGHRSCSQAMALHQRAIQRIDRHEIIPVRKQQSQSLAINPATGQPWVFWFVDNTSSSNGTYESPFPTLLAAQNASSPNEVIYVFPGNGSTTGMASGITLKNVQMLLGASVPHDIPTTVGTVTIPPLASTMPNITNTAGDVITLAGNDRVSGFHIDANFAASNAIKGTGIANFNGDRNVIVTNTHGTNGVHLINPTGQVTITSSTFSGFSAEAGDNPTSGNGVVVELTTGNTLDTLNVLESSFSNTTGVLSFDQANGVLAYANGGTITNANVANSRFSNFTSSLGSHALVASGGTITHWDVSNNTFTDFNDSFPVGLTPLSGGMITNGNVFNNTFTNLINSDAIGALSDGTITDWSVSNNTFISLDNCSGITSPFNTTITHFNGSGNVFNGLSNNSFGFLFQLSTSSNLEVFDNTFIGGSGSTTGYAVNIQVFDETTCLDFRDNSATPTPVPIPYSFTRTLGTFNRTTGSDPSTNSGAFFIGPGVGAPGTCP